MEQERSAQRARERASVPMTAASDFVVPEGTDELSRSTRRAWRDRLNDASSRKMALGVLATLVGGSFWGFSGTSASFLFDTYHVDTLWLMSVRQILAGLLFMVVVDRRMPRARETIGIGLALGGTFLIATGGDPTSLSISPLGLVAGLMCAVSAACMAVIPAKILPEYGSPIVTGSAMLTAGVVSCVFVQPWAHMPALDAAGIEALAVFVVIGSFFAYMLYMQGVKDIGSVRASLIGTVEPVSATITSAVMLGTVFLPTDLIGFAMIIVMMFLTV